MANRVLTRLGVDQTICVALSSIGVTTSGELLITSPIVLMSSCNLSYLRAIELIEQVSAKIAPTPITALQYLHQRTSAASTISTSFLPLDNSLKGGLLLGAITDLCGPPGIGKTQFCLSCVVQQLADGQKPLNISSGDARGRSSVIYIDAELKLDPTRLIEIAEERFPEIFSAQDNLSAPHNLDELLTRIKILRPNDAKEFESTVQNLQTIVVQSKASLVVIDSIAAIVRKENWDEKEKESFLVKQSQMLKMIAEICNCAILATNQVTPAGFYSTEDYLERIYHDGNEYVPTLGRTWYHCVNTRLAMTTLRLDISDVPRQAQNVITVQKSPLVPVSSVPYQVSQKGIVS